MTRFIDTYRARSLQAASGGGGSPAWGPMVATEQSSVGTRDHRRAREQVRSFTYWTYVAVKRICDMFSEPFPQIGYKAGAGPTGRRTQSLIGGERRWVKQHYGGRYIQSAEDDLRPLPEGHPLISLLQRVNSEDSYCEFAFEVCMMWHLTGEFYLWVIRDGLGVPWELWVIPTTWITPVHKRSGELKHWKVEPEGRPEIWELPPGDVLRGKFKSPISKTCGYSALQAAPIWFNNVEAIEWSRHQSFKAGPQPSVILEFDDQKHGNPKDDTLTRIEEKFISRIAGVHNAGRPLMVPPGVSAKPWSHSPAEMAFPESSDQVRDQALAAWGCPKTVAGITEDVNRASLEGSLLFFCRMVMNPLFRQFAGILTEKLAPQFDERIRLWYPDCSPESAEERREEQRLALEFGGLDVDELRMEQGREPKGEPLYQTGFVASGRIPLADDLQPEEPEPGEGEEGEEGDDDATDDGADEGSKAGGDSEKGGDDEE